MTAITETTKLNLIRSQNGLKRTETTKLNLIRSQNGLKRTGTTKLNLIRSQNGLKRTGTTNTTQPLDWNVARQLMKRLSTYKCQNTALMITTGFLTGYRLIDILSLTWRQILSNEIILQEKKTKKRRPVKVHNYLSLVARATYSGQDLDSFVFASQSTNGNGSSKAISRTAANKRINRVFDFHGIEAANNSSHTLRKTFAFNYYDMNGRTAEALTDLSELLNHSSIAETRKYIGITKAKIENTYLNFEI